MVYVQIFTGLAAMRDKKKMHDICKIISLVDNEEYVLTMNLSHCI